MVGHCHPNSFRFNSEIVVPTRFYPFAHGLTIAAATTTTTKNASKLDVEDYDRLAIPFTLTLFGSLWNNTSGGGRGGRMGRRRRQLINQQICDWLSSDFGRVDIARVVSDFKSTRPFGLFNSTNIQSGITFDFYRSSWGLVQKLWRRSSDIATNSRMTTAATIPKRNQPLNRPIKETRQAWLICAAADRLFSFLGAGSQGARARIKSRIN